MEVSCQILLVFFAIAIVIDSLVHCFFPPCSLARSLARSLNNATIESIESTTIINILAVVEALRDTCFNIVFLFSSLSLSSFATVFWDEESEVEEYGAAVNSERAVNGAVFDLVSVFDLTTGQL